jgi:hypothetical protein
MIGPVAERVEHITPEWLTQAMQSAGHDLVVSTVRHEQIGTGQIGSTYRLVLAYEGRLGPSTLVAKLASADESRRALVSPGYAAEVGFYLHLAPQLHVDTPRCWYGAIAEGNSEFTLILDDMTPAIPGVQADGCTVAQAAAAIDNLLGLHVPLWNDPALEDLSFLLRSSPGMAAMLGDVMKSATDGFVERYESDLGKDDIETLRGAAQVIAEWQMAGLTPFSAIHGDYRLDNLLFAPTGDRVVVVDWQTVAVGPPMRDVAYFLGTSLDSIQRKAHETQLVSRYHDALVARAVPDYGADQCWYDYRLGQLQGPMITVLGCMYATAERSERSDAMFLVMARRSCAAIRDQGSLDLF